MEEKKNALVNPFGGLLVTTIVLGGIWFAIPKLKSSRPIHPEVTNHVLRVEGTVSSRLWQDPFEALGRLGSPEQGQPASMVANLISSLPKTSGKKQPLNVLGVMCAGGPYAADRESRLRARYAVLSAFSTMGYQPNDNRHIGVGSIFWPQGLKQGRESTPPDRGSNHFGPRLPFSFEWFEKSCPGHNPEKESVLLVWLNANAFAKEPLQYLAYVIKEFDQELNHSDRSPFSSTAWHVLGPRDSDMLKAMFTGLDQLQSRNISAPFWKSPAHLLTNKLSLYSCFATVADAILSTDQPGERRAAIVEKFQRHGIQFHDLIAPDDLVVRELVRELERRQIPIQDEKCAIALVAEWDTLYGRLLPLTVAAEVECRRSRNPSDTLPAEAHHAPCRLAGYLNAFVRDSNPLPTNIYRFSYMRGADGQSEDAGSKKGSEGESDTAKRYSSGMLERPEGTGQLDYMRRLGAKLKEADACCRQQQGNGIQAVGVLGSDLYDKLLVLQALRPVLPQAEFFTIDLDARFLHRTEIQWTRNILVGSSFGLELCPDLQQSVPPFRDTYQTARYYAVLQALQPSVQANYEAPTPRIFEIGKRKFFDLTVAANLSASPLSPHPPRRAWSLSSMTFFFSLLAGGILVLLLAPAFPALRRGITALGESVLLPSRITAPKPALWFLRRVGVWLLVLFPLVYVALVYRDHLNPAGEPFTLLGGISVWPTEFLRLFAGYLCFALLWQARKDLKENTAEIRQELSLEECPSSVKKIKEAYQHILDSLRQKSRPKRRWGSFRLRLHALLRYRHYISVNGWRKKSAPWPAIPGSAEIIWVKGLKDLWDHYLFLGSFGNRLLRMVPYMGLFLAFGFAMMQLVGYPHVPARGKNSLLLDHLALWPSVVMQIGLTFFVLDAAQLCQRLIETLTQAPWLEPIKARNRQGKKHARSLKEYRQSMQLMAVRTRVVGKLIHYPFLTLLILIVSRSSTFDRWDWPLSLLAILVLISAHAVLAVILLRRAAERARQTFLLQLKDRLLDTLEEPQGTTKAKKSATRPDSEGHLRELIQSIETCRQGAFAPTSEQPLLRALLMPFGGAGLLVLLEQLASL